MNKVLVGLSVAACAFFTAAVVKELGTKPAVIEETKLLSPIIRLVEPGGGGTFCTAVVITKDTAITANHCINMEIAPGMYATLPTMEIRATDNKPIGIEGAPLWWDFRRDIALIKGDFSKFKPRRFLNAPEDLTKLMKKSTKVISCGYPYHGPLFCSSGNFVDRTGFHWGVDTVILPGMSGGPTMTEDGTVVGINDAVDLTVGGLSIISPTYNMPTEFEVKK